MVALPAMVSWAVAFCNGRGAEGGGMREGCPGSLACLVSSGSWWVRVGSAGRGILSVVEDDGMLTSHRARKRWREVYWGMHWGWQRNRCGTEGGVVSVSRGWQLTAQWGDGELLVAARM
jgi:hypothetical protein